MDWNLQDYDTHVYTHKFAFDIFVEEIIKDENLLFDWQSICYWTDQSNIRENMNILISKVLSRKKRRGCSEVY